MDALYELSWWIPAAMAIGAVVLFWVGNNRLDKRMKLGAVGLFLAAIGLAVFSHVMESDRETVVRRSGELVKAIENRDRQALLDRMAPRAHVMQIQGRETIADAALGAADNFKLKTARIASIVAEDDEGLYIVRMQVAANFDHPTLSNWRLDWVPTAQGWVMARAIPEGGPGVSTSFIEGAVGRWRK